MSIERRRQMIEREHASLSIVTQCRLVSISRSSFYYAPVAETAETLAVIEGSVPLLLRPLVREPCSGYHRQRRAAKKLDFGLP